MGIDSIGDIRYNQLIEPWGWINVCMFVESTYLSGYRRGGKMKRILMCVVLISAMANLAFAEYITTNDGVKIYYEAKGKGKPLVMIHGWSCSGRYFDWNFDELAKSCRVIRLDLRGHGQSDKPTWGYTMPRMAKDVYDLIEALKLEDVTLLGWSMGGAVIWAYHQLFGNEHLSKMVIVDQSPAQYLAPDWQWCQPGCYDQVSLEMLHLNMQYNERATAEGVAAACLAEGRKATEEETNFFAGEMMKSPYWVKYWSMRDHTNHDWRSQLPQIKLPTLVCVGRKSMIFNWRGSAEVGKLIPNAKTVFFENSGHMLFYEEAAKFNREVANFVNQ
jgi:pimeloyl-ACP methyl ester carboxylesterase